MTSSADSLHPLPWDSNFLGFGVARLAARALPVAALAAHLAAARQAGLRLLYVVADPADTQSNASAQAVGGWLADRKVTFGRLIGSPLAPRALAHPVLGVTTFSPELEALAWQSGAYSRFRRDPQFAPGVFERLYSHWLRASLTGELARTVLACPGSDGTPTGLLTLQERGPQARIGLLAVRAGQRGRGQGGALVAAALRTARAWGCERLSVVTQLDNQPACRFYAHVGFATEHQETCTTCGFEGGPTGTEARARTFVRFVAAHVRPHSFQ